MHLAQTYWGVPSFSSEIGGQYHLPPSACGLRGSGWYWPPISQDSDGIPQYVLARCMVFLQYPPLGGGGILVKTPIKRILLLSRGGILPQPLRIRRIFSNTSSPCLCHSSIVIGRKINYSVLDGWIFSRVHPPRQ